MVATSDKRGIGGFKTFLNEDYTRPFWFLPRVILVIENESFFSLNL
jgi:hypothetical protein